MTTVWPASTFPVALDSFSPALLDGLDDVLASHQMVPALALVAVQTKLGIDGDPISGLGGVGLQAAGKAANPNAATPLIPTIWVDNAAFTLKYSYNSIDYDIFTSGSASLQAVYEVGNTIVTTALKGDFSVTGLKSIVLGSDENVVDAISLTTNGGTTETISITNTQGNTASAIDINAVAGGIDIDAAKGITINTSSVADAITIGTNGGIININSGFANDVAITGNGLSVAGRLDVDASGGTGVTIDVASAPISIDSTYNHASAINLTTNGGALEQITIQNTQGTNAAAIGIIATAGGLDLDSGSNITIDAAGNLSLDAGGVANVTSTGVLTLNSTGAGLDIDANGNIDIDTSVGSISLDAAAGNFTTLGLLTLNSTGGGIDINAPLGGIDIDSKTFAVDTTQNITLSSVFNAPGCVSISTNGGTFETISVTNAQGTSSSAITLTSSAGGVTLSSATVVDINASTNVTIDATNDISIDSVSGNFTTTTGDLVLSSSSGAALLSSFSGDAKLTSTTGDATFGVGVLGVNFTGIIAKTSTTPDILVGYSNGDIEFSDAAGPGNHTKFTSREFQVVSATAFSILGGTSSIISASSLAISSTATDLTLSSNTSLDIDATTALSINSSTGAINLGNDAVGGAINIGTGASARTITVGEPVVAASITTTEIELNALLVDINAGATGMTLDSAGDISLSVGTGDINLATAGGAGTGDINITTAHGGSGDINLIATSSRGLINLNTSGPDGITLDATAAISIDSGASSNFTVTEDAGYDGTLTLSASNAGAGLGVVAIEADSISLTGGLQHAPTTVSSATHTTAAVDTYLFVSYTATGSVIITISTAEIAKAGRIFYITDTGDNASVNNITINTEGAQTISGEANAILDIDSATIKLISDGSNLWVI